VRTVVLEPNPEFDALLKRRQALGQDGHDELWAGEYHMAPIAHSSHGYVANELAVLLHPLARRAGLTGTSAFNLGSADDYRVPDHGLHRGLPTTTFVPTAGSVTWPTLHAGRYAEAEYSPLLGVTTAKLAEQIDWPPVG
jgi:hypothetical protein